MKIGSKLLLLRHQYSFSQEYVADKLNISQSTYSRIESDIFPPRVGFFNYYQNFIKYQSLIFAKS
jgi:transcriptional regulator with XRE-family HTH domain